MSSGQQRRGRGPGGTHGGDTRGGRGFDRPPRGGSGDRRGGSGYDRRGGDGGGGHGDSSRGPGGAPPPGHSRPMEIRVPQGPPAAVYLDGSNVPAPDAKVTAQENALVEKTKGKIIDGFPGRSGYGTQGKPIVVRTNYFAVNTAYEGNRPDGEKPFYRYDVDIQPELSKPKRHRLLAQLMRGPLFSGKNWATDYSRIVVTTSKIEPITSTEWERDIVLESGDHNSQPAQTGPPPAFVQQARTRNTSHVKITYTGSFNIRELIQYLQSTATGADYAGADDLIQLLNIILCKAPSGSATVANVGQNKFYPFHNNPLMEMQQLGGGLQALRGYFSSVRPAVNRLLVNLNVSSGAFYEHVALTQLIQNFDGSNGANDKAEAFIHHLKVKARYIKDNQKEPFATKTKTIVGFAKSVPPTKNSPGVQVKRFGNANEVTFSFTDSSAPNAQAQNITVFNYFRTHHGITLRRPDLPVLNVATKADPQYLPQELCTVLPGQPYRRLLGSEQTSYMIKFAARPPNLNAMSIAGAGGNPGNGLKLFSLAQSGQGDAQAASVSPWGFRVGTTMITVPARILSSPKIVYGRKQELNVQRASWNLKGVKFHQPGSFGRWQVFTIGSPARPPMEITPENMLAPEPLFKELERQLASYGIVMGERGPTQNIKLEPLSEHNRNSNNKILVEAFEKAKDKRVEIILMVLPVFDKWLYARIKFYADTKYGIHTIGAIGKKLQNPKGQDMYMGNLALKFNIKGGGTAHSVPGTLVGPVATHTMFFGIDVTHPSPGSSEGAPSIACVVANTDANLFQWPGSIRQQEGRVEMVQGLTAMVVERLKLYQKRNRSLPNKIVIYRDGVSEGQFKQVLEKELPFFLKAYKEAYGEKEATWPKTAIIVVSKRHHTRFYPTTERDADQNPQTGKGSWNTQPGTVVDRGIVGKVIREFYIQAHQGLQGTVKPAKYSVIKDDIGFTADQLERLTLNLCYHFVRCTKAVSVCPPAYYADLLAERGRAYLFSTLQEDHGTDSSAFDGDNAEWTGGVHAALAESTWYI